MENLCRYVYEATFVGMYLDICIFNFCVKLHIYVQVQVHVNLSMCINSQDFQSLADHSQPVLRVLAAGQL